MVVLRLASSLPALETLRLIMCTDSLWLINLHWKIAFCGLIDQSSSIPVDTPVGGDVGGGGGGGGGGWGGGGVGGGGGGGIG